MRKKIVAGNWKMNKTLNEGNELARAINKKLEQNRAAGVEVIVCPPFIHINTVSGILNSSMIKTGAQNCSSEESGAYTGEIAPSMIKSAGADYVIIGHSERRSYFGEVDDILNKKVRTALNSGLQVIFCCGEVLSEREKAIHFDIVKKQLQNGLFNLSENEFANIVVAYEPVWAIGTGVTATSAQAQEMHGFIRKLIAEKYGIPVADETTILYGGSCNPKNAKELFSMEDVDGGLIGGASLKSDDFYAIIDSF